MIVNHSYNRSGDFRSYPKSNKGAELVVCSDIKIMYLT